MGSVPPGRAMLDSQQSVETQVTDVQTPRSDDGDSAAAAARGNESRFSSDGCCNACTSTLRLRNRRVTSHHFDDPDTTAAALFHSSRERLVAVQRDSSTATGHVINDDDFAVTTRCTDASCSCHVRAGADNPTFVSDNVTSSSSHRVAGEVSVSGGEFTEYRNHHHVTAAQALMQPVNGGGGDHHRRIFSETSGKPMRFDDVPPPPLEMACYSVRRNGNGAGLVIEDLESGSCVVSTEDSTLMELNDDEVGRPQTLDVREAWPDKNAANISTDRNRNDVSNQLPVRAAHCLACKTRNLS